MSEIGGPSDASEPIAEMEASSVGSTARAGGIMVAGLFLSRVLGIVRDTVIASKFGLLADNDAYRNAILVPDLIFMLIAGGGLSTAFIPVFTEFWYTDRKKEAWKAFSVVVTVCSVVAVLLIAGAWALAPAAARYLAHNEPEVIRASTYMSRVLLPAQFAFLIGSILIGTLYARKRFAVPVLAPNIYNLGIIFGAAFLPAILGLGIASVAWGAVIGAFIGNMAIPVFVMMRQGDHFMPSFDVRAPGVKKFFTLLLPVIVGFSLPSVVNIVTQTFASNYSEGVKTVLSYSNNLMQAPLGIFGQSLALAAFPVLSQFFAQNRMDLYKDQISRTMRTVLYLCVPSSALLFALAPLVVQVIYGYGKASRNTDQLALIATCLRIYCPAIAAWCLQPVLMRGFFSLHRTFQPIALSTAMTAFFIAMCYAAQRMGLSMLSLPWATDIAAVALVAILFVALEMRVGRLDLGGLLTTLVKSAIGSVPLGLVAWGGSQLFNPHSKLVAIAWFGVLFCASAWAYYFTTRALKMPETSYVDRALDRLQKKAKKV